MIIVIANPPLSIGLGLAGVDKVIEVTNQSDEELRQTIAEVEADVIITHDALYERIKKWVAKKPCVTISLPEGEVQADDVDQLIAELS